MALVAYVTIKVLNLIKKHKKELKRAKSANIAQNAFFYATTATRKFQKVCHNILALKKPYFKPCIIPHT